MKPIIIKEDKIGKYQVLIETRGKPTTIRYAITCKKCGLTTGMIGSLVTRKKTLSGKLLLCPFCERNMFDSEHEWIKIVI
jgi:hypothetical protein